MDLNILYLHTYQVRCDGARKRVFGIPQPPLLKNNQLNLFQGSRSPFKPMPSIGAGVAIVMMVVAVAASLSAITALY